MNLIQRVEEAVVLYGGGTRKDIGEFILREKSHLYRYSIQEIADATYTSKAALVRFAKELGFKGWRDFLKAFVEEQKYQESHYTDVDPNFPFTAQSSRQDIINQICSLQVESILDTADLLDSAPLEEAVGRAKAYLSGALAAMLDLGKGSGPMDHNFLCSFGEVSAKQEEKE